MNWRTCKSLIFLFSVLLSLTTKAQTILIDPGHGGIDCGAKQFLKKGNKTVKFCEKDLVLQLSKVIKKELEKHYRVYLTRSFDRTLSLDQRAKVADKIKADLFISVHANSFTSEAPNGFETFYLSNNKDKAVAKIESVENRDATGQTLIVNQILADLVIERTAPRSKMLAHLVHKNIAKNIKVKYQLKDRGAKPALFYVLALSKRPSVLLEPGFLSNKHEAKRLRHKDFQLSYARGVVEGVIQYFKYLKKKQ
ncbi:MAG: N-acetylmuramoyl-L-alanine amidase family protein [Bacteriovoracaceae bacterium]